MQITHIRTAVGMLCIVVVTSLVTGCDNTAEKKNGNSSMGAVSTAGVDPSATQIL